MTVGVLEDVVIPLGHKESHLILEWQNSGAFCFAQYTDLFICDCGLIAKFPAVVLIHCPEILLHLPNCSSKQLWGSYPVACSDHFTIKESDVYKEVTAMCLKGDSG